LKRLSVCAGFAVRCRFPPSVNLVRRKTAVVRKSTVEFRESAGQSGRGKRWYAVNEGPRFQGSRFLPSFVLTA